MFWILFKTIIIGIIEGITEWLPISSTGHMILANEFIKLNVTDEFWEMFEVVIQLGAIMAVVILFFKDLFPWGFGKTKEDTKNTFSLWFKIVVGCIPCAIIGLLFDDYINDKFYNPWTVAIMLIVYGVIFIIVENINKNKKPRVTDINKLSYLDALKVGLFQVLSIIPGTSRSGSTIVGGMIRRFKRDTAFNFSFILYIPISIATTILGISDLFKSNLSVTMWIYYLTATLVAGIITYFATKWFRNIVKNGKLIYFVIYCVIVGLLTIIFL